MDRSINIIPSQCDTDTKDLTNNLYILINLLIRIVRIQLLMHQFLMLFQIALVGEYLETENTLKWLLTSMNPLMRFQATQLTEGLVANVTIVGFFSSMSAHMCFQAARALERLLARETRVRLLIGVIPLVQYQIAQVAECF